MDDSRTATAAILVVTQLFTTAEIEQQSSILYFTNQCIRELPSSTAPGATPRGPTATPRTTRENDLQGGRVKSRTGTLVSDTREAATTLHQAARPGHRLTAQTAQDDSTTTHCAPVPSRAAPSAGSVSALLHGVLLSGPLHCCIMGDVVFCNQD
ncbi:hypothetical protein GDO78_016657 [Eleutherodactylus coqui]|uniref:Uncharacterized protein n=1 Tax=Eleutherodactylus coqui TaxID=57060 RepID=A0A8J6B4Z1_ELECQ|nr:hypothetical protein GDO78_016657 [Eleutherodactylus coqui]